MARMRYPQDSLSASQIAADHLQGSIRSLYQVLVWYSRKLTSYNEFIGIYYKGIYKGQAVGNRVNVI